MKFAYTFAETDDLLFLLRPIQIIIDVLTGSRAIYVPEEGYVYQQLHIVIDKSCSGFNLGVLYFIMLLFQLLKFAHKPLYKFTLFPITLSLAYLLTVFVNAARIFISILVHNLLPYKGYQEIIHQSIGIVTNLSFLIIVYLVVSHILSKILYNEKSA